MPTDADLHPPTSMLVGLLAEISRKRRWGDRARLDSHDDCSLRSSSSEPLSACCELLLRPNEKFKYSLSQKRSSNKKYITTTGPRDPDAGRGKKKTYLNNGWPRTQTRGQRRRLQPMCIHRWICIAKYGPPSTDDMEASHTCGNDACINPNHLQWSSQSDNWKDRAFHLIHPPVTIAAETRRFSRITSPTLHEIEFPESPE